MANVETARGAIKTILDPTAIGLGRDIPRIASIAARIDLNIVAATGMYIFDVLPHYFRRRTPGSGPGDSDPMVEMFVRDITQDIANTGIKAGVLKCSTDLPGVTPGIELALRSVAQANRRPDHNAHPCRLGTGPGTASYLQGERRRSGPCGHRPQRRYR
jgi:phosphotriesterase-related protein